MTQREYENRRRRLQYAERRDNGLCVRCGAELNEDDHIYCPRCSVLVSASEDRRKDKKQAQKKVKYERCKAEGVCVRCGHRRARNGKLTCTECAIKMKRYDAERYIRSNHKSHTLRGDGYHCSTCYKPVEVPGTKLCSKCYENSVRACMIMKEKRLANA